MMTLTDEQIQQMHTYMNMYSNICLNTDRLNVEITSIV